MIFVVMGGILGGIIGYILFQVLRAYIKLRSQRNDVIFKLKFKETVEGDTFWQQLGNLNKELIKDYHSLGSCAQWGTINFYLPAIFNLTKKEQEICVIIYGVDEHESLHRALFRTGISGKYHHKIMEKMEVW